jgi:hypothetical protein
MPRNGKSDVFPGHDASAGTCGKMTKLSCAVHAAFIPMLFNNAVWILKASKSHLNNNGHEN